MLLQHFVSPWQLAANIAPFVACGVGMYHWRKLPVFLRLIFVEVTFSILFDTTGWLLHYFDIENNAGLYNIYWFFNLWFTGMAAWQVLNMPGFKKMALVMLYITTIAGFYFVWAKQFTGLASYFFLSACVVLTFLYLLVLVQFLSVNTQKLFREPVFLLSVTLIIYYACNIPFWAYLNYLNQHQDSLARKLFGIITHPLNVLLYSSIAICFALAGRRQGELKPSGTYG